MLRSSNFNQNWQKHLYTWAEQPKSLKGQGTTVNGHLDRCSNI